MQSERYQIDAKADGNASRDRMFLMLQSLLTERFGMRFHFEKRSISSYTLVADKPKLKAADPAGRC